MHRVHGEEPDLWDGCSEVMGNSVPTWNKHYFISRRDRGAASAINAHAATAGKRRRGVMAKEKDATTGTDADDDGCSSPDGGDSS